MKFTNTILSILFLILSCIPCADMKVNNYEHTQSEFASNQETHSHNKEKDLCSPFCICSCCGSQIVSYFELNNIDFPIPSEDIKTQLPSYKSVFTSNFFGSIWQPPQIV